MAAVGRVEELAQAVLAGGGVGGDESRRRAAPLALDDGEAALPHDGQLLRVDALDCGQGRRVGAQAHQQGVDRPRIALGLEQHPALVVQHPPRQAELGRHAVDEGPEPDPLHGALDARPHAPPGAGDGPQRLRAGAHYPARSTSSRST